jgi:hypothetical protein
VSLPKPPNSRSRSVPPVQPVRPVAARQDVETRLAQDHVVAEIAGQGVRARAALQPIVVPAAEQPVVSVAAVQGVGALIAEQHVVAAAALDPVVAGAAEDLVRRAVAGDHVGEGARDGVLDHGAEGHREIADHPRDVAEGAGVEVQPRRLGEAGQVDRVDPARVPDGHHRAGVHREVVDAASGGGLEPVDGVPGAGGRVRAVDRLEGRDVVQHQGARERALEVAPRGPRSEVGQDRVLDAVLRVLRVLREGDLLVGVAVVLARMREAERVHGLVQQDIELAPRRERLPGPPLGVEGDLGRVDLARIAEREPRAHIDVGHRGRPRMAPVGPGIGQAGDRRPRVRPVVGDLHELHACDVGDHVEHGARRRPLRRVEGDEALVGGRVRQVGGAGVVEAEGDGERRFPPRVPPHQVGQHLVQGPLGLARGGQRLGRVPGVLQISSAGADGAAARAKASHARSPSRRT